MGRYSTFPHNMNPCIERERAGAAERRQMRLKELALDWTVKCSTEENKGKKKKKGKENTNRSLDAARIPGEPTPSPSLVR